MYHCPILYGSKVIGIFTDLLKIHYLVASIAYRNVLTSELQQKRRRLRLFQFPGAYRQSGEGTTHQALPTAEVSYSSTADYIFIIGSGRRSVQSR